MPTLELERSPAVPNPHENTVAVINLSSQHTLEIQDSVQRNGVKAEVFPHDVSPEIIKDYGAIILSGGSNSLYDKGAVRTQPGVLDLPQKKYGICYGAYLLAEKHGGKVKAGKFSEMGRHAIMRTSTNVDAFGVFAGKGTSEQVWMNHGDRIKKLPKNCHVIAKSANGVIAGFSSPDGSEIGVQFHPEVNGTEFGDDLVASFLFDVAKLKPTFEPESVDDRINKIRDLVGTKQVLMFLSGGVDSSVMAKLIQAGVPKEQIQAVLIDHGFMRLGETEKVKKDLAKEGIDVTIYDAYDYFLNSTTTIDGRETPKLRDARRPEEKRKIIGDAFMKIQSVIAEELQLPNDYLLAQGSIRPDLIESGSHGGDTIKTHHNDSPLARKLRQEGRIIEPVADLYKPGIRALGKALGLSDAITSRQPFPGPGLAIRILREWAPQLEEQEVRKLRRTQRRLGKFATQSVGVHVTPVRSVGQQGDGRRYGRTVVLHGEQDWVELLRLARTIPEKVKDVTRVTYAFDAPVDAFAVSSGWFRSRKQLAGQRQHMDTFAITTLEEANEQLKSADLIVREELTAAGLDKILQQVPVISIPHGFDKLGRRSIVLRPFLTHNFMTGTPALPGTEQMPLEVLNKIVKRLQTEVSGIGRVLYDLTGKPPGTTEWE